MNDKHDYRPGAVVSVRFGGVLRHYGVVTFDGRVVSNNGRYGGVVSQSIAAIITPEPTKTRWITTSQ